MFWNLERILETTLTVTGVLRARFEPLSNCFYSARLARDHPSTKEKPWPNVKSLTGSLVRIKNIRSILAYFSSCYAKDLFEKLLGESPRRFRGLIANEFFTNSNVSLLQGEGEDKRRSLHKSTRLPKSRRHTEDHVYDVSAMEEIAGVSTSDDVTPRSAMLFCFGLNIPFLSQ